MKLLRFAIPALSLAMLASSASVLAQYYGPPQGPPAWDAAPPAFRAAQQRGFHDGVEGARKDFENHRRPDVNNRDEYRNPKFIAPPDRRDYRYGFRQGYETAVRHMYGPGPR